METSDLIFFIGSNTDSANTDRWRIPSRNKTLIHLDISEAEVGNNYNSVNLIGDAKATLRVIIDELRGKIVTKKVSVSREEFEAKISELERIGGRAVNPLKFIRELWRASPEDAIVVADPGTGAIYASSFFKAKVPGRHFIFNYGLGGLGYAIPASVGAYLASNSLILTLTGDGSFGFSVGELETVKRMKTNSVIFVFNNSSYGWIRAEMKVSGKEIRGTDFSSVDYVKIAEGFG